MLYILHYIQHCFQIDYKQRLGLVLFLWLKPNSRTQANEIRNVSQARMYFKQMLE